MSSHVNMTDAFYQWWSSNFWVDAYDEDDKATARAGWAAALTSVAAQNEKLITLRALCDKAEQEGWQHIAVSSLRAILGEAK